jgi:hypothetical protein
MVNPLNTELNPICHILALLGAHPILDISGSGETAGSVFRVDGRDFSFSSQKCLHLHAKLYGPTTQTAVYFNVFVADVACCNIQPSPHFAHTKHFLTLPVSEYSIGQTGRNTLTTLYGTLLGVWYLK